MRSNRHRREASDQIVQRVESPFSYDVERNPKQSISAEAEETLQHNDWQIWQLCRYAAIQAMPIQLAKGISTDEDKEAQRLRDFVQSLVGQMLDEGETWIEERLDRYDVRVGIAFHRGPEFSSRNKNEVQLEVEIGYTLESMNLHIAPSHYKKVERIAYSLPGVGSKDE